MDTYSDNGNDSNVVRIWSKRDAKLSDDPLEDLLNEFGTETEETQSFAWEEELLGDLEIEDSEIDLMVEKPVDYFYQQLNCQESKGNELEDVSNLVHKARYLSNKLKYYNTYLLNKE